MLVDSHCHLDHLDLADYQNSLSALLDAARQRGVEQFLSVGVDLESSARLVELARDCDDVLVSVGVHPLQRELPAMPEVEQLVALGRRDGVVAIGETGLDNYYGEDSAAWQEQSFIRHLQAAAQLRKPVIVHTREAREQTLAILRAHADRDVGGVIHCFTESWEMARAAMDLNFLISFSGIITFRNAEALRDVVKRVPLENMLVETDAPWLAPVPYRGKQNEPKYVLEVAQMVADIKGVSPQEVAAVTTANFRRLFLSPR
ncbi:MAG: TatD family deoxyribonuclease [Gammaproteobacteria bacterium]|nr:MAG: TatD family deoxyribonuclease [Gammaproteobacteria bacterium]